MISLTPPCGPDPPPHDLQRPAAVALGHASCAHHATSSRAIKIDMHGEGDGGPRRVVLRRGGTFPRCLCGRTLPAIAWPARHPSRGWRSGFRRSHCRVLARGRLQPDPQPRRPRGAAGAGQCAGRDGPRSGRTGAPESAERLVASRPAAAPAHRVAGGRESRLPARRRSPAGARPEHEGGLSSPRIPGQSPRHCAARGYTRCRPPRRLEAEFEPRRARWHGPSWPWTAR